MFLGDDYNETLENLFLLIMLFFAVNAPFVYNLSLLVTPIVAGSVWLFNAFRAKLLAAPSPVFCKTCGVLNSLNLLPLRADTCELSVFSIGLISP